MHLRAQVASGKTSGPTIFTQAQGRRGHRSGIAGGKAGDLLVLDIDPLQDIAATLQIRMVVSRGAPTTAPRSTRCWQM